MKDEAISALLQELDSKDIRLQLDGGKLRLNAPKGAVNDRLKELITSSRDALIAHLQTDVKVNGSKLTTLEINPWLLSVGVGYRF